MSWTKREAAATFQRMVEDRHKEIGLTVARLREAKGWSQETLAYESKLSVRTISRIENGKHEGRGGTLRAVAKALEVPLDAVMRYELEAYAEPSQLDRIEALLVDLIDRVVRLEAAMPSGGDDLEAELESGDVGRPPARRDDDTEEDEPEDQAEGR